MMTAVSDAVMLHWLTEPALLLIDELLAFVIPEKFAVAVAVPLMATF